MTARFFVFPDLVSYVTAIVQHPNRSVKGQGRYPSEFMRLSYRCRRTPESMIPHVTCHSCRLSLRNVFSLRSITNFSNMYVGFSNIWPKYGYNMGFFFHLQILLAVISGWEEAKGGMKRSHILYQLTAIGSILGILSINDCGNLSTLHTPLPHFHQQVERPCNKTYVPT